MNADFDLLDHAVELFPAPERSLDRLTRRRDRKRRNQRITAAVLALIVAAAAIGGAIAIFRKAEREHPLGGDALWVHRFLTEGHDGRSPIAADASGVYALTDTLLRPEQGQNSDLRLTRYDFDGNVVWSRTFGTTAIDDGEAIELLDGSIYLAAKTHTFGHYLIARFEEDGRQTWLQTFDNPGTSRGIDMAVAPDAIYIAIDAEGQTDNLLRRYDLDGNELWTLRFGPYLRAVTADASGVYVTSDSYTRPGITDAVLRKFDPQGNELWTDSIERPSNDSFSDVVAAGGGLYAVGYARAALPGQATGGIFVQRYDRAGNLLWTQQSDPRAGMGILYTAGGAWADETGVYLGAFAPQSGLVDAPDIRGPFVRKLDPSGNVAWTQHVPESIQLGESVIEVAVSGGRTFVSWETGPHASPHEADWTGFIEALSAAGDP